jgi:hypothetical protein
MNRRSKKLVLHRETLRPLNPTILSQAAGGSIPTDAFACGSNQSRCCYRLTTPARTL